MRVDKLLNWTHIRIARFWLLIRLIVEEWRTSKQTDSQSICSVTFGYICVACINDPKRLQIHVWQRSENCFQVCLINHLRWYPNSDFKCLFLVSQINEPTVEIAAVFLHDRISEAFRHSLNNFVAFGLRDEKVCFFEINGNRLLSI